jgi:hypothetical protein
MDDENGVEEKMREEMRGAHLPPALDTRTVQSCPL